MASSILATPPTSSAVKDRKSSGGTSHSSGLALPLQSAASPRATSSSTPLPLQSRATIQPGHDDSTSPIETVSLQAIDKIHDGRAVPRSIPNSSIPASNAVSFQNAPSPAGAVAAQTGHHNHQRRCREPVIAHNKLDPRQIESGPTDPSCHGCPRTNQQNPLVGSRRHWTSPRLKCNGNPGSPQKQTVRHGGRNVPTPLAVPYRALLRTPRPRRRWRGWLLPSPGVLVTELEVWRREPNATVETRVQNCVQSTAGHQGAFRRPRRLFRQHHLLDAVEEDRKVHAGATLLSPEHR